MGKLKKTQKQINKERQIRHYIKQICKNFLQFVKWVVVSGFIGVVVGLIGVAFSYGMHEAAAIRDAHPLIVFGLPAAGIVIMLLYHLAHRDDDKGTNSVLSAVRSEEKLTISMAPLIFVGTILTHLFGGSAGREGAALQLGGSIGSFLGKILHMNKKDWHIAIMCGMSACFSALFGTPTAAAVFPMEVVDVGRMNYSAFVPCAFSSVIAAAIARGFGVESEAMTIPLIPEMTIGIGAKIVLLSMLCAVLSVVFCVLLHLVETFGKKWIPNRYIRIAVAGALVAVIHFGLQTTDYMGAGMHVIERCMEGEVKPEAFLLKMILTALTIGAGYKGGEIVPSFFVGATFGCLLGTFLGISPALCAAVGMIAVFCGVTNSPVTSLLIAVEIFGMEALPYFLLGVAISYMLSGYHSLYHAQRIVSLKFEENDLREE